MRQQIRWIGGAALLALLLTPAHAVPAAEPASMGNVTAKVLRYAFNDAEAELSELLRDTSQPERQERLLHALLLLVKQPRTGGNLERAAQQLRDVIADNPEDDIGLTARYYLARYHLVHRMTPDLAEAARCYDEILADAPSHPMGQAAAVKRAMLWLYDTNIELSVEERASKVEMLGAELTKPDALRDFHLVVGYGLMFHRMPADRALPHMEASLLHPMSMDLRADVMFAAGELALEAKLPERARRHFEAFIALRPRDARVDLARLRISTAVASGQQDTGG